MPGLSPFSDAGLFYNCIVPGGVAILQSPEMFVVGL